MGHRRPLPVDPVKRGHRGKIGSPLGNVGGRRSADFIPSPQTIAATSVSIKGSEMSSRSSGVGATMPRCKKSHMMRFPVAHPSPE